MWKVVLLKFSEADAMGVTASIMGTLQGRMESLEDQQNTLQATCGKLTAELQRNNTTLGRYVKEKDAFEQEKYSAVRALA